MLLTSAGCVASSHECFWIPSDLHMKVCGSEDGGQVLVHISPLLVVLQVDLADRGLAGKE